MNYNIVHTLNQFNLDYQGNLKEPSCIPICLEDLCAGWTVNTIQQVLSGLTLKNTSSVPLFFLKPEDLSVFSNKLSTLNEVFKLFDTRGLSRIDSLEFISIAVMTTSGTLTKKIEILFSLCSVSEEPKISKDTFIWFLDSYTRGLSKTLLKKTDTFYPRKPNMRLLSTELDLISNALFKRPEEKLSPDEFVSLIQAENGALKTLFTFYPALFQQSQENYRDVMLSRVKLVPFIKSFLLSLISSIPNPKLSN